MVRDVGAIGVDHAICDDPVIPDEGFIFLDRCGGRPEGS